MHWNGRTMLGSAAAVAVVGLGVLAATRVFHVIPTKTEPSRVWSSTSITSPVFITGADQKPFWRLTTKSVVVVDPRDMSLSQRRHLGHLLDLSPGPNRPFLWMGSRRNMKRWLSMPGIFLAKAQLPRPVTEVPLSLITPTRRARSVAKPLSWTFRGGEYRPDFYQARLATTLSLTMQRQLVGMVHGAGAILIVQGNGLVEAGWGRTLSEVKPLGLSALPPLLAIALNDPGVSQQIRRTDWSLPKAARRWTTAAVGSSLQQLGLSEGVTTAPAVAILAGRAALSVTPMQLAQSYLPFLDHDQAPRVVAVGPTRAPSERITGQFGLIEREMPQLTVGGMTFGVWRPAGSYAVILAPRLDAVAVLQGAAQRDMLAIMQRLSQDRRASG